MVRISGRSKGCVTCLKRKIRVRTRSVAADNQNMLLIWNCGFKCDETIPECSQCVNGGRNCPGAVAGMVFLLGDTNRPNPTARKKARRLPTQKEDKLLRSSHVSNYSESCLFASETEVCALDTGTDLHAGSSSLLRQPRTDTSGKEQLYCDLSLQVTTKRLFMQQALSHFINFFAKDPPSKTRVRSWMHLLPDMLSSRTPAVKMPIIAASVVYMGSLSNDKVIVMEGYKWYGSSLERQRRQLQLSNHRTSPPTVEEICMPLMLSFFEIICSTSPTAYSQHITGASRLLEVRGPQACMSGILHQLFQTIRVQAASIFAKEEWLTIPFQDRPKTVFDRIVDVLIRLPRFLTCLEGNFLSKRASINGEAIKNLAVEVNHLKESLDNVWDELKMQASSHGWKGDFSEGTVRFDFDDQNSITCGNRDVRDAFTASIIALYSTARILVLSILSQTDSVPLPHEELCAHSASILHAAEFLDKHGIGCAYVRLILPLKVVSLSSPGKTHRARARTLLEDWRMRNGMRGICEVVLSEIERESTSSLY